MRHFIISLLSVLSLSTFAFNFDSPGKYIDKVSTTRVENANNDLLYFEVFDQNSEKVIGKVRYFRDYERLNLLIRSSAALGYSFSLPVRESDGTFDLSRIELKEPTHNVRHEELTRGTSLYTESYKLISCEKELSAIKNEMALEENRQVSKEVNIPAGVLDITKKVSLKSQGK